ncbi:MAG: cell division protein ZapE [Cellvibrionales bacterium]|nr:cell division protein ZapE [Cellvibrionales bacterium]
MTPLEKYQQDLERSDFFFDASQKNAIEKLQALYDALLTAPKRPPKTFISQISQRFSKKEQPKIKGLYFWGGVGRGKTYLMDSFYESLPFNDKWRLHFHRFMQKVHGELKKRQGEVNPLDSIAESIAQEARVICFDEFFVTDITDAMILGGLFEQLFDKGVVLVATSNIVPDNLYENGLQRQRFLPAIAALKENCEVVNVDSGEDYRLRALKQAALYYSPLGSAADKSLLKSWCSFGLKKPEGPQSLVINDREIPAIALSEDAAWVSFQALCDGPRSQNDYIEIARLFNTVLVANVPVLTRDMEDQARRFINLVDEFYDRQVKVIISAEAGIDGIYQGQRLLFEIERTQSRLLEMQSEEYLAKPHRP